MSDIKKINIVPEKKEEKQSKKRAVTNSTEWIEHKNNFSKEEQLQYLSNIYNKQNDNTDICKLIHKHTLGNSLGPSHGLRRRLRAHTRGDGVVGSSHVILTHQDPSRRSRSAF